MAREPRCSLAAGAFLGGALVLRAATASADEPIHTASLSYAKDGGTRCPDEESFRHQVAARLGYQPFATDGTHRVSVHLSETGGRVHGHAEVTRSGRGTPGVRDLDGRADECGALTAALAVAVAIALDPVRSARAGADVTPAAASGEPGRPPAPPAPAPPPPEPTELAQPITPGPDTSRVAVFGAAAAVAAVGLTPGPSAGGSVGAGLRWRAASVELAGRAETMPGPVRVDSGDRLEATAFSALLAACAHLDRVGACALGRVGAIQGRAPDVTEPTLGTTPFGAVGARVAYTQPLSRTLALRALASAELPLVRTSFVVDDKPVWTAPPVLAGLEVGVVFTIP